MAASLADILASLDNGVRAINNLSVQLANSLTNIPVPLSALSTDAYATGNWTPVATFATPGDLAVTYSAQNGIYTMVGREVFAQFDIITTVFTFTTSSGAFQVTGLPFTSAPVFRGSGAWSHLTGVTALGAGYTYTSPRVETSATLFDIIQLGTVAATLLNSTGNFTSGTNLILRGYVQYTR